MAESGQSFVEWKEEFVSKERGKRVVHYFLKEKSGESVLAVVGTERSIRHMFYVVAEEFLRVNELNRSVNAAYRWRSRREVVNWLTSMLSKQHQQDLPKGDHVSGVTGVYQSHSARNSKLRTLDIVWSGETWTCGKQLKHFPAFCRNGITIAVHSFVFVMAEGGKRHLAFLEDMYEDRKGQKKVKVRWFHHNQEVNDSIILKNPHPKEVFVTPYTQVISVECVDGPAIVLTREHYNKCESNLPEDLLSRVFLCFRQFKSNRFKPFKLSKLRGYFGQSIFSFLDHGYDDDDDMDDDDDDDGKLGSKRSSRMISYEILRKKLIPKYAKNRQSDISCFKVNEKVELLCQDSGIRGCWFRCTVLRMGRRRIKVRYDDLIDEDGSSNLEEWVSSSRLAIPDKLGLRHSNRPTIRPAVKQNEPDVGFEVGSAVDAWWSDGWWEGVVTEINIISKEDTNIKVYLPGETLFLNVHKKDVRVSRDWVGDRWVNVKENPNARLLISDVATKEGPHNEIYADDVRMDVV